MENIGKELKEKRIEQGMSVEDISVKTRLTPKHIKALEEGDISFFRDDLSYLRFFVKSYCDAVHVDFEDYKNEISASINDYTMTSVIHAQKSHQEMERNIAKSDKLSRVESSGTSKRKRRSLRKPDFSLVSLIAIIGVVVVVILFAFVMYLRSDASKPSGENGKIPVAPEQEGVGSNKVPGEEKPNEEEKEEPVKKEMSITRKDATHFILMNLNDGDEIKVDTKFIGSNSAYSVTVDGQVKDSKVYTAGNTATTVFEAKKGMKFQVYIGFLLKTEVRINDKVVNLDEMQSSGVSYTLEFTVGDSNESAQ